MLIQFDPRDINTDGFRYGKLFPTNNSQALADIFADDLDELDMKLKTLGFRKRTKWVKAHDGFYEAQIRKERK